MTPLLCLLLLAAPDPGAKRVPYGGELVVLGFDAPWQMTPGQPVSSSSRVARAASYESLYRREADGSLTPVLASGPPLVSGKQLTVPLRSDVVRHDGAQLTAEDIVGALQSLGAPGSASAFVLSGVKRNRDGTLSIKAGPARLEFELEEAGWDLARRLAGPWSAIAVRTTDGLVGTGPFRIKQEGSDLIKMEPFAFHRDGRPFLDALEFRVLRSRAGAVVAAGRQSQLVLRIPPSAKISESQATKFGTELLVLVASKKASPHLKSLDARIDRKRLLRALGVKGARAFGASKAVTAVSSVTRLSLVTAPEGSFGSRPARHLQVALAPAGFRLLVSSKAQASIVGALRDDSVDLWLASIAAAAPIGDTQETMIALDSVSCALGLGPVFGNNRGAHSSLPPEALIQQAQSEHGYLVLAEFPVRHGHVQQFVALSHDGDALPGFADLHQ